MGTEMPVVVGVDGSPEARRALEWAAADALHRRRALRILHAYVWPMVDAPVAAPMVYEHDRQDQVEEILRESEERARAVAPGVEVVSGMAVQQPAAALIEAAHSASTVVVGNRGRGGFAGLLLGSVGVALAAHAECPVVIVRRGSRPPGLEAHRIVVGLDGSHEGERALEFAFEEAGFRGAGLTVLHAYDRDDEEQRALVELTSRWAEKYPDVDVRYHGVHGRPAEALTNRSAGAELLVVGSRGRGGFTGLLLGSVSQATIHHADCPVAIVKA